MKLFFAHASDFAFKEKLYAPLRASALNTEHVIILPQEHGKEQVTRDVIGASDVFVLEASAPSTGAGIETGWASAAGVPIIALYERGSRVSSSVDFVANEVIEYESPDDMLNKLTDALVRI